jgi:sec-independent protein translocase protein TatA
MGGLSPVHWLLVLLVVLLLFGAGRLSEIGKGLGEGIKNFKKGLSDDGKDDDSSSGKPEPKRLTGKDESKGLSDDADDEALAGKQKSKRKDEGSDEKRA